MLFAVLGGLIASSTRIEELEKIVMDWNALILVLYCYFFKRILNILYF
jgi:hypothetical protein